jgi:hypothetical protein
MKGSFLLVGLCLAVFPRLPAQDSVPKTERQIVFGVSPFDGAKYLTSFLPESQKEMLLTAGENHTITVLLSDVYYWPITAEYRADFQGVHIPLVGNLSIYKGYRGEEILRELKPVEYIYVYPRGPEGESSRVLAGEEMSRFIEEVEASQAERAQNPNQVWASFQGPFTGFIVNLPEGKYRLVFSVKNQGQVFTIEKTLRVFSPIGTGTAYQIIPDEKWTVSSNSETIQQRIYLKPESVIYLKLFPSIFYSQADYERMTSPQRPFAGMGLENSPFWVHEETALEESGDYSLLLEAGGQTRQVRPREFLVRQTEGSALGYTILEFDPPRFPGSRPSFTAYRLAAPPPGIGVSLTLSAGGNKTLRYLRSLEPRALYLSFLAFVFPLLLLAIRFTAGLIEYRKIKQGYGGNESTSM